MRIGRIEGLKQWFGRWCRPWSSRRKPGADGPDDATLLAELRAEHSRTRSESHAEVGSVLLETEASTLALSTELDAIVYSAQTFIDEIKHRLGELENHEDGSVSAVLDGQHTLVTSFLERLSRGLRAQQDAANRMLSTARSVSAAAESVTQISVASRLLCINTMIEAARLGDQGQPMIVIADQMRSLSERIGKSNEAISKSIAELLPVLEDVESKTASVDADATGFRKEFSGQAERVLSVSTQLRETVEAVLGGADQRLDGILGSSHRAITSLQTQDLVSQRLRRVLQVLDRSGTHPDEASGDADKPERGTETDDGQLDAGQMMMF